MPITTVLSQQMLTAFLYTAPLRLAKKMTDWWCCPLWLKPRPVTLIEPPKCIPPHQKLFFQDEPIPAPFSFFSKIRAEIIRVEGNTRRPQQLYRKVLIRTETISLVLLSHLKFWRKVECRSMRKRGADFLAEHLRTDCDWKEIFLTLSLIFSRPAGCCAGRLHRRHRFRPKRHFWETQTEVN